MIKIKLLLLAFLTGYLFSCAEIKSEIAVKEKLSPIKPFLNALEDSILSRIKETKFPGAAVAVVYDSSVVFLKAFGLKEKGTNDSVNVHTVFRVASLSKGFTSVLTGILVEKGLINWDDPVTKYYPDIAFKDSAQTNRIQIRHLLSHTSGLPRHAYTNLIEDGLPLENILSRLKTVDLISREGSLYAYQNAAFALVEKVLERAASDTFNSLLEQKIFLPAGMQNASVQYTDLHENKNIARPHQYSSQAGDYVPVKLSNKYFNAVSAGGISASASDMAQWLLVMLGNRPDIISQQTLDYIFTPVIDINTSRYSRRWRVRKSSYALGWRVLNLNGRPIIYHSGYVNAYRSEIVIDKKNRIGVCILFNAPHRFTGDILPGFFNSIDEFYSDRLKEHEEIRG